MALSVLAGGAAAQRAKPPVARLPDLPPAVLDDTLQIGGKEINARKIQTRMTVEVRLNDQGPYHFVVDSGADSSVIGERAARAQRRHGT